MFRVAALLATLVVFGFTAPGGKTIGTLAASAECNVRPRSMTELRALLAIPTPDEPSEARAAAVDILSGDPNAFVLPVGRPLDATTADSVSATVLQFYACAATGDRLAVAALATDDWVRDSSLAVTPGGTTLAGTSDGVSQLPTVTPIPKLTQSSLPVTATPAVLRGVLPNDTVQILDSRLLPSGHVGAVVALDRLSDPASPRRLDYLLLRRDDGGWLIDGRVPYISDSALEGNSMPISR